MQIAEDSLEEMDEASGRAAIEDIAIYVDAVVNEEWKAQSPATVSRTADAALERLRTRLLPLEAKNPGMVAEIDQMLDEVERRRLQRLLDLEQTLPPLFWILSILLFFAMLVPASSFTPSRVSAVLIGTYGQRSVSCSTASSCFPSLSKARCRCPMRRFVWSLPTWSAA